MNWDKFDMSEVAIAERLRAKAAARLFSERDERIIVGWIIYQDLAMLSTTTEKLREFVMNYFGVSLQPSYISKFMARWNLSLKLVGNASRKELVNREAVINETTEWLCALNEFQRRHNIAKSQIKAIDKTYLYTSPFHRYVRHIGPRGRIKSRKIAADRGLGTTLFFGIVVLVCLLACLFSFCCSMLGHELWTTLSADGRRGPFVVKTTDPKLCDIFENSDDGIICYVPIILNPKTKKNIAPGERATLAYLYEMVERNFLQPGDILIYDAEAALSTPLVQEFLFRNRIYPFVLPCTLHALLNPCDNTFHSVFKMRYYRLISAFNGGSITSREKLHLAKQCYFSISEETVASMFLHNGLVDSFGEERRNVTRLMCEGLRCLDKGQHKVCLINFLKWCRVNALRELCPIKLDLSAV